MPDRKKSASTVIGFIIIGMFVLFSVFWPETEDSAGSTTPVTPNWAAIAAWPNAQSDQVAAQPDPNRKITAIVLDDSGSMRGDIDAAKQAVVDALGAMSPDDRVAILALNAGIVMPFSTVQDAQEVLPDLLSPIRSDGRTPLTKAVQVAQRLLEAEASTVRGFGSFRLIVTTDGVADNQTALDQTIVSLAASTPIQVTTIGIDISGNHTLRRSDIGSFVDVANVAALKDALQAAVAENTDFAAITRFSAEED